MASKFKLGDLVWAKLKGFPAWPGKIIQPTGKDATKKLDKKNPKQFIFFYGSENHAWIPQENIWMYATNKDKFIMTKRIPKGFDKAVEEIEEAFKNLPAAQPSAKTSDLPSIDDEIAVICGKDRDKGAKDLFSKDYSRQSGKGKKRHQSNPVVEKGADLAASVDSNALKPQAEVTGVTKSKDNLELHSVVSGHEDSGEVCILENTSDVLSKNTPKTGSRDKDVMADEKDLSLKKEDQSHEREVIEEKKEKTPKVKAVKRKQSSPHVNISPKKSRSLVKTPSGKSTTSGSGSATVSVKPFINNEKAATATISATASSTSGIPKDVRDRGYDGWSSTITPLRKESPMFDRSMDRILEPSMVEPILSKNIIPTPLKIGFLGLGIMGSGMVANLLKSGHEVTVWNRTPSKCKEFVKDGALKGNSPAEVVQQCDITLSCVADPTALKDLVFGNCGVLQGISQGKAYVDLSTVDVETITDVHEAVTARGGRFLEAPVIGSKQPAHYGNLIVLAAGDRSLYDDCYSCFEAIGKRTFFLGEIGSAAKMKLVSNLIMGTVIAGLAESLALAEKVGLEQEQVLSILDLSPISCPLVKSKGNAMVLSNYSEPHCKLHNYQKDLRLAVNMSDTVDQPLHVGSAVNELFKKAKAKGYGEHDTAAVYRAADL